MLELAVLGLLSESPLHGYELRKRLAERLGWARRVSFGSLYPTLRKLQASGLVTASDQAAAHRLGSRNRVVYEITAEGKERLAELLSQAGPSTWEDEAFGLHVAFFSKTDPSTRLRVLEGRRVRLEERREGLRTAFKAGGFGDRMDRYTLGLQQLGLDTVEREVRWLSELIDEERSGGPEAAPHATSAAASTAALTPTRQASTYQSTTTTSDDSSGSSVNSAERPTPRGE
jgi:DNA-binding PadR family transcriptional regulator